MNRAAQLRSTIEGALARRIPAALTPQLKTTPPVVSTGIAELDVMLGGGLPIGAITEIVGTVSSGRTSCAQAFVARVLAEGQVGAWVDVSDAFDPESAAANGIDLSRLLWVRCSGSEGQPGSSEGLRPGRPVPSREPAASGPVMGSGGSPHPRSEVRGLPEALDSLFTSDPATGYPDAPAFTPPRRARNIGTPGMPNRDLHGGGAGPRVVNREEQVATDRLPSRRGAYLLAQRTRTSVAAIPAKRSDLLAERRAQQTAIGARSSLHMVQQSTVRAPARFQAPNRSRPWSRLDQALRAMDLVLQAGGFGTVVLDLSDVAPEFVSRIPLATWFRFRAAAERTRVAIVLLTRHPCAQSSAEVVLRTQLGTPECGTVLSSLPCTVEVVRQRFRPTEASSNILPLRKQPQRVRAAGWSARAMWAGGH